MRALGLLGCTLVLMTAAVTAAYAASGASFTGDRSLVTKFRLDDGLSGAAGYQRARWTTTTPVKATLQVRNAKGRVVETIVGGNPYSDTAALTWILPTGQLVISHALAPAGLYRVTLNMVAYVTGSVSQLTTHTVTATWTAKLPSRAAK